MAGALSALSKTPGDRSRQLGQRSSSDRYLFQYGGMRNYRRGLLPWGLLRSGRRRKRFRLHFHTSGSGQRHRHLLSTSQQMIGGSQDRQPGKTTNTKNKYEQPIR